MKVIHMKINSLPIDTWLDRLGKLSFALLMAAVATIIILAGSAVILDALFDIADMRRNLEVMR